MFRTIDTKNIDSTTITSTESGAAVDISQCNMWSAQVIWTSTTASATVQIEESNDGTTWSTISGKTQAISNDSSDVMLSSTDQATKYIRATLNFSSGSVTTLKVYIVAKSK
jgi:hypothetical protein